MTSSCAEISTEQPATRLGWYCARTKPKNEHIAAANLRRLNQLEVFHPRLRTIQTTRAGITRNVTEPLFPGYIFVRCNLGESLNDLRSTSGVSSLVSFGAKIPEVPEGVVGELIEVFGAEETLLMEGQPAPGDVVNVSAGAFLGVQAVVLRSWPAKQRVQILLDILGRPTPMEVDSSLVSVEGKSISSMLPELAIQA